MAIFNRNLVKPLAPKSAVVNQGFNPKLLDKKINSLAEMQPKEPQMMQPQPQPESQILNSNRTPKADTNLLSNQQPESDADRINRLRQGLRDNRGQLPSNPNPQMPAGPRVGSTPFSATVNQQPTVESDADRVNRLRQGIRETGQLPSSPNPPQMPAGPRRGSTPFSATVNQGPNGGVVSTPEAAKVNEPPPKSNSDRLNDIIDRITGLTTANEAERAKAREAAAKSFDVKTAEAMGNARARGGAMGAGLLGATTALESQASRAGAREKITALDEMDRANRGLDLEGAIKTGGLINQAEQTALDRLRLDEQVRSGKEASQIDKDRNQREKEALDIARRELEVELNQDLDGDGLIAGRTPEEAKAKEEADKAEEERQANPETQDLDPTTERRLKAFAARYDNDLGAMPPWEKEAVQRAGGVEKWVRQEAARQGKSIAQFLTEWQDNIINTGIVNMNRGWSKI